MKIIYQYCIVLKICVCQQSLKAQKDLDPVKSGYGSENLGPYKNLADLECWQELRVDCLKGLSHQIRFA
jgi:hypothetical protein